MNSLLKHANKRSLLLPSPLLRRFSKFSLTKKQLLPSKSCFSSCAKLFTQDSSSEDEICIKLPVFNNASNGVLDHIEEKIPKDSHGLVRIYMPRFLPSVKTAPNTIIEETTLLKWSVKEGDKVALNDVLCEIYNPVNDSVLEYRSVEEGYVQYLAVPEKTTVPAWTVLALLSPTYINAKIEGAPRYQDATHYLLHGIVPGIDYLLQWVLHYEQKYDKTSHFHVLTKICAASLKELFAAEPEFKKQIQLHESDNERIDVAIASLTGNASAPLSIQVINSASTRTTISIAKQMNQEPATEDEEVEVSSPSQTQALSVMFNKDLRQHYHPLDVVSPLFGDKASPFILGVMTFGFLDHTAPPSEKEHETQLSRIGLVLHLHVSKDVPHSTAVNFLTILKRNMKEPLCLISDETIIVEETS